MNAEPRNPVRRAGRYLLDTFAMGGTARAGVASGDRRASVLQTRAVMDAILPTATFEEEQSERQRAIWSSVGAVLLGGLGVAMVAFGLGAGSIVPTALGVAEVALSLLVIRTVLTHTTSGSLAHLAGIVVLAVATYVSILAPPPLFGDWALALPAFLATILAVVCLVVGRRG